MAKRKYGLELYDKKTQRSRILHYTKLRKARYYKKLTDEAILSNPMKKHKFETYLFEINSGKEIK